MSGRSGPIIANGIISFLVLLCGIIFSVLVAFLLKKVGDIINDDSDTDFSSNFISANMPVWALGFAYIVPGILGIISALVKQKGMYITQMVFCILTLLVMAVFFLFGIFALSALAVFSPDSCLSSGDICKCAGDTTVDYSCDELTSMYAMGVSAIVFVVLAWGLVLTTTILAGILTCRQEPLQQGMVIHPSASVVTMAAVPGMGGQQIAYVPQTHDNAKLVHNMQY